MPAVWGTTTHAKIASGQTVSGEVDLRGLTLHAITVPTGFTGVTLSFQAAEKPTAEGGVYLPVWHVPANEVAEVLTITTVTAGTHMILQPAFVPSNCMLKLVSGGAEAADRDLILFLEPY